MFKKSNIIGLDIGISSVKLVQFLKRENSLHLLRADLREIKYPDNKTLRDKDIAAALKNILKGVNTKGSKIAVSVNCPMTSIKAIPAPYMPKSELQQALKLEAKNYFPFDIDTAALDFEILGDTVEKGVKKYKVAVAVSPEETVNSCLGLLGKAGIKPHSIAPCSYALQKLSRYLISSASNSAEKENKTRCLIDIGNKFTELLVVKDGSLMLSRKMPVTGGDFTRPLQMS